MKRNNLVTLKYLLVCLILLALKCNSEHGEKEVQTKTLPLPEPVRVGEMTFEEALQLRRSVRSYTDGSMTLKELSQLLWSAQGITSPQGFRTAPSAGALYPLEIYAVVGDVEGLPPGMYKYSPSGHALMTIREGDLRKALSEESTGQQHIEEAAADIVIAAVYERTTEKYDERGRRYVHMEVGHAAQNVCLQAQSLDLGVCTNGAFDDDGVKRVLGFPADEDPLYIISVGRIW